MSGNEDEQKQAQKKVKVAPKGMQLLARVDEKEAALRQAKKEALDYFAEMGASLGEDVVVKGAVKPDNFHAHLDFLSTSDDIRLEIRSINRDKVTHTTRIYNIKGEQACVQPRYPGDTAGKVPFFDKFAAIVAKRLTDDIKDELRSLVKLRGTSTCDARHLLLAAWASA